MNSIKIIISPGMGGVEANSCASILLTMYLRWCQRNSVDFVVLPHEHNLVLSYDVAALGFEVEDQAAIERLRGEFGVHRITRISPFDPQLRRHTSYVNVRDASVESQNRDSVRGYCLHPYQLVKDHRTGLETSDAAGVLDGDLDQFFEAMRALKTG